MDAIKPQADLIVQQRELEDEMTQMGIVTMQQKVKGAGEKGVEDRTVYGTSLLDHALPKVVAALRDLIAERSSSKAARRVAHSSTSRCSRVAYGA